MLGLAAAWLGHVDRSARCDRRYLKLTTYFDERLRARGPLPRRRAARPLRRQRGRHQRRAARHRQLRPAPRAAQRPVAEPVRGLADRGRRGRHRRQDRRARRPGRRDDVARTRHAGARAARPETTRGTPDTAKLTVYVGRQDRAAGRPAYHAVCDVLHRHGFAGASVFLGVDGTARGQRQRARFFSRNVDVPVMIIAVGTGAAGRRRDRRTRGHAARTAVHVERAQLCKRDGQLLARPAALPADRRRRAAAVAEADGLHVGGHTARRRADPPRHRSAAVRLRAASGATVLRGIWGFHGDHEPHGDKLIQLARRVPVTTIVVDTPDRIAAELRHHRRTHRRARAGHQRAGSRAGVHRRRGSPRRHRIGALRLLSARGASRSSDQRARPPNRRPRSRPPADLQRAPTRQSPSGERCCITGLEVAKSHCEPSSVGSRPCSSHSSRR